jgi:TPP-dependent pyruvate/acetoin dehydrogenase alpha subunit
MHIADPATGNLGANAIVGGSAGIATGAAYSSKYLKNGRVAVCFFGEGALGQGLLYEELNLAQLWQLPVIFACENNGYNEYTHFSESTAGDVAARAQAFGMANETIDGQNVRDVFTVASKYIERARNGDGPAFLQFKTYRYHGHHVGDIARAYYRPKAEEQEWVTQRDPITLHGEWLMSNGVADRAALDAIQDELIKDMDAAVEFAVDASYPDPSKVDQDIYA